MKLANFCIAASLFGLVACHRAEQNQEVVGPIKDLEFLTSASEKRLPFIKSGVKVFLFSRTDCPISNRYAPEVNRMINHFKDRGVTWWLVYPNRRLDIEKIERHRIEYAYDCSALHDPQHQLVRLASATTTPEAAVFGENNQLFYCGRIDDRYVAFGKTRPKPTRHDLRVAIENALQGNVSEPLRNEAIGCLISDLE